jgi:hypothetical protein
MCFVPDGESAALSCLAVEQRQKYSDEQQAFAALGRALAHLTSEFVGD